MNASAAAQPEIEVIVESVREEGPWAVQLAARHLPARATPPIGTLKARPDLDADDTLADVTPAGWHWFAVERAGIPKQVFCCLKPNEDDTLAAIALAHGRGELRGLQSAATLRGLARAHYSIEPHASDRLARRLRTAWAQFLTDAGCAGGWRAPSAARPADQFETVG